MKILNQMFHTTGGRPTKMMSKIARRRKGGFTLIEIMIVVLIIGILLAIAIPNFMRAREASRAKSCCANLRQVETAKEQWAMDTKAAQGDPVVAANIDPYIKGTSTALACPSGGTYDYTALGTNAACDAGSGTPGTYDYHGLDLP